METIEKLIEDKLKDLYYDNRTLYTKNKNLEYKVNHLEKKVAILWFLVIYVPIIYFIIMLFKLWLFN